MYLGTDLDLPFEWNVFEPLLCLLWCHGTEHAELVAKVNGFLPEFEYQREACVDGNSSGENMLFTRGLAARTLVRDRVLRDAKFGHPVGVCSRKGFLQSFEFFSCDDFSWQVSSKGKGAKIGPFSHDLHGGGGDQNVAAGRLPCPPCFRLCERHGVFLEKELFEQYVVHLVLDDRGDDTVLACDVTAGALVVDVPP